MFFNPHNTSKERIVVVAYADGFSVKVGGKMARSRSSGEILVFRRESHAEALGYQASKGFLPDIFLKA